MRRTLRGSRRTVRAATWHGNTRLRSMKVFISWSGSRSLEAAKAIVNWLPMILHYVKPWLSESGIEAGSRWSPKVAEELEQTHFGILLITPENLTAPWVLFEAGAIAKSLGSEARVVPVLLGVDPSQIAGPLAEFQAKNLDSRGMYDVVRSIQSAADEPHDQAIVDALFENLWPPLQETINEIPESVIEDTGRRSVEEILDDLVLTVRSLGHQIDRISTQFSGGRTDSAELQVIDLRPSRDRAPVSRSAVVLANAAEDVAQADATKDELASLRGLVDRLAKERKLIDLTLGSRENDSNTDE